LYFSSNFSKLPHHTSPMTGKRWMKEGLHASEFLVGA